MFDAVTRAMYDFFESGCSMRDHIIELIDNRKMEDLKIY